MNNLRQRKSQAAAGKYIDTSGGYPIYQNSSAKYYPSGEAMFEEMIEDLKKQSIIFLMEFFIVEEGYDLRDPQRTGGRRCEVRFSR